MVNTLQYPDGEFTQAELADSNGREKLSIYFLLQDDLKSGIIVKTGTRPQPSGRGKASNLYRLVTGNACTNSPGPILATVMRQTMSNPPPVVSTPPVAKLNRRVVTTGNLIYKCPLCDGPMTVIADDTGIQVWCNNIPCDPLCHENVYGHGSNVKEAYDVARHKFWKP